MGFFGWKLSFFKHKFLIEMNFLIKIIHIPSKQLRRLSNIQRTNNSYSIHYLSAELIIEFKKKNFHISFHQLIVFVIQSVISSARFHVYIYFWIILYLVLCNIKLIYIVCCCISDTIALIYSYESFLRRQGREQ